ncbi:MAG: transcriptional regulator [Thermoplasmatota archaeon]
MVKEKEWNKVGSVLASKYKRKIIGYLTFGLATPRQIANGTDIRINHVSNYLSRLSDDGLVICVNPDVKMGRLYTLTDEGKKVATLVEKISRDLD